MVLPHTVPNPNLLPDQTTSTNPQTSIIYITTSTPVPPATTTIYKTPTPPPFPEQFSTEMSAFSQGIKLDVAVNDTNPRLRHSVAIIYSITNVNSSEQVCLGGGTVEVEVLNSEGKAVYRHYVFFPQTTLACPELLYIRLRIHTYLCGR